MKQRLTLAEFYPELAAQWHPTKNGTLSPCQITRGSVEKVWWLGECGHEWEATVLNRVHGSGCPVCNGKKVLPGCNDLATIKPELAAQWHPTKNGALTPYDVTKGCNRKVWWQCDKGHEWQASPTARRVATECPHCKKQKAMEEKGSLKETHPELAAQWHPTQNGDLTPADVTFGSAKAVWWKCQNGHEWKATIGSRARGSGCALCYWNRMRK